MEETSYQMVEILSFSDRERTQPSSIEIGVRNFVVKKGTMKLSGESCLENTRKKIKLYIVFFLVVLESKVQKYCSAIFFFNCDPKHQSCSIAFEIVTSQIQEVVFFSKGRKYMGLVYTVNTFLFNFLSREQARVC